MESNLRDPDLKGAGFAVLRLGGDIERRFGINGEVAAYFSPWLDFQRRSFNAIALRTSELARGLQEQVMKSERFTPSRRVALLISSDPNVDVKLDEWQNESYSELTIVPVDPSITDPQDLNDAVIRSLRIRLGERDLYQTQNPVSGVDFFGRSRLLRDLGAAIEGDQNVAILGLRRSGKTSVLRELGRQLLPRRVLMPIADFQMLEEESVDELASSIASNLNEELKLAKSKGMDVWIGDNAEQLSDGITLAALSDRLKRVASRNHEFRVVIAVDEVEGAAAIARVNPTAVKVLLGALRSAAQARENISLVFSGVANRMFRSSSLGDAATVDNPIFGQVVSVYLTSFDEGETGRLLRELGQFMMLDWSDEAVSEVQQLTGGFPFFVRDLASAVRKSIRSAAANLDVANALAITGDDVRAVAVTWSGTAAEAWAGIVKALGLHYSAAAALLDPALTLEELNEWVLGDADAAEASEDLVALRLLERNGDGLTYSSTLAALQRLGRVPTAGAGASRAPTLPTSADPLGLLIREGESHTLEFKETSRINTRTNERDVRMEDSIVKSVAGFLNARGGDLLIGVNDDGIAKGLDADLAIFKGSVDRFERWLRGDLLAKRIDQQLVTDNVDIKFLQYRGKQVVRVSVRASVEPAWVDDKTLYRRQGNQTVALEGGRELQKFLTHREQPPS